MGPAGGAPRRPASRLSLPSKETNDTALALLSLPLLPGQRGMGQHHCRLLSVWAFAYVGRTRCIVGNERNVCRPVLAWRTAPGRKLQLRVAEAHTLFGTQRLAEGMVRSDQGDQGSAQHGVEAPRRGQHVPDRTPGRPRQWRCTAPWPAGTSGKGWRDRASWSGGSSVR